MQIEHNIYKLRYKQTSFDLELLAQSIALQGSESRVNLISHVINQIKDGCFERALFTFLADNYEIGQKIANVVDLTLYPLVQIIKRTAHQFQIVESPAIEGYTELRDEVEGDTPLYEIRFKIGDSALIFEEHDRKIICEGKEDEDDLTPTIRFEPIDLFREI